MECMKRGAASAGPKDQRHCSETAPVQNWWRRAGRGGKHLLGIFEVAAVPLCLSLQFDRLERGLQPLALRDRGSATAPRNGHRGPPTMQAAVVALFQAGDAPEADGGLDEVRPALWQLRSGGAPRRA